MTDRLARRRILMVIPALSGGGAEKVILILAGYFVSKLGCQVGIATLRSVGYDIYRLPSEVERIRVGSGRTRWYHVAKQLRLILDLRRAIFDYQPHAVVSFLTKANLYTLLALLGKRIPVFVSERTDPRRPGVGLGFRFLRRVAYRIATAVVVQTEVAAQFFRHDLGLNQVHVIPNPVRTINRTSLNVHRGHNGHRIIAMGRLQAVKGFDSLIKAFASTAAEIDGWELAIYGEGPEREALQNLVARLCLSRRVSLPGWTDQPAVVLSGADVFVLSSQFEGFPNALVEAMAAGLAVVSFDCPSGPSDIIEHGVDGLLVPVGDIKALANAISLLVQNPEYRASLGKAAVESVKRYSLGRVGAIWEHLVFDA